MLDEKFKGLEMIENKDPRPEVDHRLAEVFKSLGMLEERLKNAENQISLNNNNLAQFEKDIFKKFDEVIGGLNALDKQLYANAEIEKVRKEAQATYNIDRRETDKMKIEERKITIGYWPIMIAFIMMSLGAINFLWNVIKEIQQH